ncbi:acetyl-CoA carboxylase biotin carboxylase subunit family protein [Streptacidiphilus sp. N1-12]|uniref:Acetyl-CoA carboxylase biotin carboxylase subunit family protein n=2 Tax=Streptacidiphilus alkalitolerans TaxID=3342712 RepID=A0ABV6WEP5_9ACTN
MPVLLVVYDSGSVGPARLARAAAENDCELIFLAADSQHARAMVPALEAFGGVVDGAAVPRSELLRTLTAAGVDGIVTFSEFQIGATAELAEDLGLAYHSTADVDAITRKDRQRQRFAERGVDSVRHRTITSVDQIPDALAHVGLPAIIKPIVGASSRHTVAVATAEECRAVAGPFLLAETALLVEELLVGRPTPAPWGDYIAVDCVASGDDVAPVFVTSKFALAEPFRERGGYGARSMVDETGLKEVQELACRAVKALNIRTGLADVEIKLTAAGPRVIEVNGRLGGWVDDLAVRSHTAAPVDLAVRSALGREVGPPTGGDGPIAFHYLVVPPIGATRVRRIGDSAPLTRLAHVDRVAVLAEPGASADWRIGAPASVAAVLGTAEDHGQLAETVAAIERTDWIDYE